MSTARRRDIHERIVKVFQYCDGGLIIHVSEFTSNLYWVEVVSDSWVDIPVAQRALIAKERITELDPSLLKDHPIVVLPLTKEEFSIKC